MTKLNIFKLKNFSYYGLYVIVFGLGFITSLVIYDQTILNQIQKHNMIITDYYNQNKDIKINKQLKKFIIKDIR